MLGRLRRPGAAVRIEASVPAGLRVYAVGDIHGRADLLEELLALIEADAAGAGDLHKYLIYLGDYIDRGPQSSAVIERLAGAPLAAFGAVHLKGNHEEFLQRFLDDPSVGPQWFVNGGQATLASYRVRPPADPGSMHHLAFAQQELRRNMPARHHSFLAGLKTSLTVGDYVFVHAGVRPGVPLGKQTERDLLWIREEFLRSDADHGKIVVHGHTITAEPELRANRIGIDTGAFATGRLTALVLQGDGRRFLST